MSIQIIKPCPCGGESLDVCCGRFISGNEVPETPEQLMRSRYSAYVLGEEAYLRATWDPATCPPEPLVEPNISWIGLEVRSAQHEGDEGIVEFVARARWAVAPDACMRPVALCVAMVGGCMLMVISRPELLVWLK